MQITQSTERDAQVVRIEGKLDTAAAEAAETFFTQLVEREPRRVMVDLAQMDYITSAGLRVLLVTAQTLDEQGGEMRLANANSSVTAVFRITGFDGILKIFERAEEAWQGW